MPDYHIVMASDGENTYSISNTNMLWSDALDTVADVIQSGHSLLFVHHIHDGIVDDLTECAVRKVLPFISEIA